MAEDAHRMRVEVDQASTVAMRCAPTEEGRPSSAAPRSLQTSSPAPGPGRPSGRNNPPDRGDEPAAEDQSPHRPSTAASGHRGGPDAVTGDTTAAVAARFLNRLP